jgi:hypothetical protein
MVAQTDQANQRNLKDYIGLNEKGKGISLREEQNTHLYLLLQQGNAALTYHFICMCRMSISFITPLCHWTKNLVP